MSSHDNKHVHVYDNARMLDEQWTNKDAFSLTCPARSASLPNGVGWVEAPGLSVQSPRGHCLGSPSQMIIIETESVS